MYITSESTNVTRIAVNISWIYACCDSVEHFISADTDKQLRPGYCCGQPCNCMLSSRVFLVQVLGHKPSLKAGYIIHLRGGVAHPGFSQREGPSKKSKHIRPLYSGLQGAKHQPNISPLPCCRFARSFHKTQIFRIHAQRCKWHKLTEETLTIWCWIGPKGRARAPDPPLGCALAGNASRANDLGFTYEGVLCFIRSFLVHFSRRFSFYFQKMLGLKKIVSEVNYF